MSRGAIPQKRLRKDDGYKKPELTYTDKLTQDEIEDKLEDYVEVKNMPQVPLGTHMRYVTNINGKKKFRVGGVLVNSKNSDKYVVLANTAGKTWSVQVANTTFYREMSKDEIKEEYEEVIDELEEQIEKHLKTIDNLKNYIKTLKGTITELQKN